jgi:hypothetical protein
MDVVSDLAAKDASEQAPAVHKAAPDRSTVKSSSEIAPGDVVRVELPYRREGDPIEGQAEILGRVRMTGFSGNLDVAIVETFHSMWLPEEQYGPGRQVPILLSEAFLSDPNTLVQKLI